MDDPLGVDGTQRLGGPHREGPEDLAGQRPSRLDPLFQGGARNVLGGHPGDLAGRVGAEEARGAEPVDPGDEVDLSGEAGPKAPVGGQSGVHGLDRDGDTVQVQGSVHHTHAAGTETTDQPVGADVLGVVGT